jgi:hypothetical protein
MPALRELQRSFGAAILNENLLCEGVVEDGFTAAERLGIYRNNCRAVLVESLRMTYPAVDRLVGRDFFERAAREFVAANPSRSGYLNEYGGEFAGFLAAFAPASALAYLADVARFEWALSVAANAEDAPALDAGALAAVDPEHHGQLRFAPHPSVRFLVLVYPADEIADAVLAGDDAAMAQIDLSSGPVRLVVHRGRDGVEAQRLEPHPYEFVSRLCAAEPLGTLLETTPAQAPELLAEQLTKGRLTAFRVNR